MLPKLYLDVPSCCCLPPRKVLLVWGYCKLIISTGMLLWVLVPLSELMVTFLYISIFIDISPILATIAIYFVLAVLWMTDVVFHSILVDGLHNNTQKLLKTYYGYCKVLWVMMLILGLLYAIIELNDLFVDVLLWKDILSDKTFIHICVMFVSLIFQSSAMLLVRAEIERLDSTECIDDEKDSIVTDDSGCDVEVVLKIDSPFINREKENGSNVEDIETTSEKTKLTV